MEIYDSRYFAINKKLLQNVGLWPYQNPVKKSLIRTTVLTLTTFWVTPQIIGLYLEFGVNLDKFLEHIAVLFYMFIIGFKVITMYLAEIKLKIVYGSIAENWLKITNEKEKYILCMYSERARLLTIGYTGYVKGKNVRLLISQLPDGKKVKKSALSDSPLTIQSALSSVILAGYMISAAIAFTSLPMTPILLDMVFPLNETRERTYILNGEYLVDRSNHYVQIYILEFLLSFSTVLVFSAHDTMYVAIVEHSLGIFAIVKYRLQSLVNFSTSNQNLFGLKKKFDAFTWMVSTIRLHKDVVEFTNVLEQTFSSSFLIVIGANSGAIIFTSILILIHFGDIMEIQRHSMVLFGLLIHLFYVSLPGQRLIDHSSGIFEDAYTNEWYASTEKVKTLLKFMIMRAATPCQLTCGGLYVLNFSNFALVLKSTASYFTVFASFR